MEVSNAKLSIDSFEAEIREIDSRNEEEAQEEAENLLATAAAKGDLEGFLKISGLIEEELPHDTQQFFTARSAAVKALVSNTLAAKKAKQQEAKLQADAATAGDKAAHMAQSEDETNIPAFDKMEVDDKDLIEEIAEKQAEQGADGNQEAKRKLKEEHVASLTAFAKRLKRP